MSIEINTTAEVSPAILEQLEARPEHYAIDPTTGEYLAPLGYVGDAPDDLDPTDYRWCAQHWLDRLEAALDHATRLTCYRRLPAGYLRYYLCGFGLLQWLRVLYPESWVDRAVALVSFNAPESSHADRLAELQPILEEFVQMPSFDPRFVVGGRRRADDGLRGRVSSMLREAGIQERNIPATAWLACYMLDCFECKACQPFARALDTICADAPTEYGLADDRKAVSRILERIVDGWGDKPARLPIFRVVAKGRRSPGRKGRASTYDLSPTYAYLLDGANPQGLDPVADIIPAAA